MFSRLRLGTQLWLLVSLLVSTAAAGLTWYLSQVQIRALAAAAEQRLAIKEDSLTAKAGLLARNAALASASAALTMEFELLQGVMNKTVKGDDTITFGYIVNAEDEVVVHSDLGMVGKTVPGAGTAPKEAKDGAYVKLVDNKTLEAVAPITVDSDVWGTVHYGVSYEPVLRETKLAEQQLRDARRDSFIFSILVGLGLVLVCICVSVVAASRLVRPLRALESKIQLIIARGANQRVEVPRLKELARMANGFNVLLARLDEREHALRRQRLRNDLASWANERQLSSETRRTLEADWEAYLSAAASEQAGAAPKSKPRGSLRARLVGLTLGLTTASVLALGGLLYVRLRSDLDRALTNMAEQIRHDLTDKGIAVTRNAALAVSQAASEMEFLFMVQVVRTTLTADADIVTGFVKDPKGRVLVHDDLEQVGRVADIPEHARAMQLGHTESREVNRGDQPIVEITAPIEVRDAPWGTLSFGLSHERQNAILEKVQRVQAARIEEAFIATGAGMGILVLIAVLVGWLAARRVVRPLHLLTRDLDRICGGDRKRRVNVHSCRELSTFSMSINELTAMTLEREEALEAVVGKA